MRGGYVMYKTRHANGKDIQHKTKAIHNIGFVIQFCVIENG